jgi:hypothetical protein
MKERPLTAATGAITKHDGTLSCDDPLLERHPAAPWRPTEGATIGVLFEATYFTGLRSTGDRPHRGHWKGRARAIGVR